VAIGASTAAVATVSNSPFIDPGAVAIAPGAGANSGGTLEPPGPDEAVEVDIALSPKEIVDKVLQEVKTR